MGGYDAQYVPTSDTATLDESSKKWIKASSLSSPRCNVAVFPIDPSSILILGGYTDADSIAKLKLPL